jgi:hypothetical protein
MASKPLGELKTELSYPDRNPKGIVMYCQRRRQEVQV